MRGLREVGRLTAAAMLAAALTGCGLGGDDAIATPRAHADEVAAPMARAAEVEVPLARGASDEPAAECEKTRAKVRLATPETAARAGIESVPVTSRAVAEIVSALGTLALDRRRVATIAAPAPGTLRAGSGLVGEEVSAGDIVVEIASAELAEAKSALRQAAALVAVREKTWAIERELTAGAVSSRREALLAEAAFEEARIAADAARQHLRILGFDDASLGAIERGDDGGGVIAVRSPIQGVVVETRAALGAGVERGDALLVIADTARLAIEIDIAEGDLARIAVDAKLTFAPDALPGDVLRGRVAARGALVDPETRTVRAIGEVKNPGRRGVRLLAPGMFGRVEIVARDAEDAMVIPREAVQWEGCHYVVFVELRPGFYQARWVELGVETGAFREVRSGLTPGERVVAQGSYLLKTEILKGSIGAGCCD